MNKKNRLKLRVALLLTSLFYLAFSVLIILLLITFQFDLTIVTSRITVEHFEAIKGVFIISSLIPTLSIGIIGLMLINTKTVKNTVSTAIN